MEKIKRILPVILVFLLFTLAGCQVKEDVVDEPLQVIEEVINYGEYEYKSVVSECEIDNESSYLVCLDEENSDYKNVGSFMNSYGEDGWELVQIMKGGEGKYNFIMKRSK